MLEEEKGWNAQDIRTLHRFADQRWDQVKHYSNEQWNRLAGDVLMHSDAASGIISEWKFDALDEIESARNKDEEENEEKVNNDLY